MLEPLEIGFDDLVSRPESVRERYVRTGVAKITGALDADTISKFTAICELIYHVCGARLATGGEVDEISRAACQGTGLYALRDTMILMQKIQVDCGFVWGAVERMKFVVKSLLEAADAEFMFGESIFRRQFLMSNSSFVPWHRDAHAVGLTGAGQVSAVWMPMCHVGIDAPSLEYILGSQHDLFSVGVKPGAVSSVYDFEDYSELWARNNYDSRLYSPILAPGDILIHDMHTLHATQRMENPRVLRQSLELRFLAVRSGVADGYLWPGYQ